MAERYLQENGSLMDKPLQECLQSLCDSSISIYKVIDSRDMICLLYTSRDLKIKSSLTVKDFMRYHPELLTAEDSIRSAVEIMVNNSIDAVSYTHLFWIEIQHVIDVSTSCKVFFSGDYDCPDIFIRFQFHEDLL